MTQIIFESDKLATIVGNGDFGKVCSILKGLYTEEQGYPRINITIEDYKTISPIPYDALEEYLKDVISNWNQKQKK